MPRLPAIYAQMFDKAKPKYGQVVGQFDVA